MIVCVPLWLELYLAPDGISYEVWHSSAPQTQLALLAFRLLPSLGFLILIPIVSSAITDVRKLKIWLAGVSLIFTSSLVIIWTTTLLDPGGNYIFSVGEMFVYFTSVLWAPIVVTVIVFDAPSKYINTESPASLGEGLSAPRCTSGADPAALATIKPPPHSSGIASETPATASGPRTSAPRSGGTDPRWPAPARAPAGSTRSSGCRSRPPPSCAGRLPDGRCSASHHPNASHRSAVIQNVTSRMISAARRTPECSSFPVICSGSASVRISPRMAAACASKRANTASRAV